MIAFSKSGSVLVEDGPSPPLAPHPAAIDREHLKRMTLGERSLEREVLALFNRQTEILLARMHTSVPTVAAAAAHTLKGSARGIGAWRVARAAEEVELAAPRPASEFKTALATLEEAVEETRVVIADMLRAN
ncbi:MAG TPA: Hpt domain-containing protein [Xanthobacteraceae bacterium]|nr:Hpt domain-containing protein [Xanthobacteraceae bacterium]